MITLIRNTSVNMLCFSVKPGGESESSQKAFSEKENGRERIVVKT